MENFKAYLETQGFTNNTVTDYLGRLTRILLAEKLTINDLPNKIGVLVQDYSSKGPKASIGKRSHSSVISSLVHYLKFSTIAEVKKV